MYATLMVTQTTEDLDAVRGSAVTHVLSLQTPL